MPLQIESLLQGMVKFNASDLHVKVGSPPGYRIDSHIQPVKNLERLTPEDTRSLAQQLLSAEQFAQLERNGNLDWAHSVPGLARFRVNAMKQRGSISLFFRKIPVEAPSLEEVGAPRVCRDLVMRERGLLLVTGPTGSGKSTTVAAMITHRNANARGHILTIEDPVEFIHPDQQSFVNQREIGSDAPSFEAALQQAFRQDPDVILVGELRDEPTLALVLTAAETDHLVIGVMSTPGAVHALERIVEYFPRDQQAQARMQLADTLIGVVSQVLVPREGGGLIPAHEVLMGTDDIRDFIRRGRTDQIAARIRAGSADGMVLLDDALDRLVRDGFVRGDIARSRGPDRAASP